LQFLLLHHTLLVELVLAQQLVRLTYSVTVKLVDNSNACSNVFFVERMALMDMHGQCARIFPMLKRKRELLDYFVFLYLIDLNELQLELQEGVKDIEVNDADSLAMVQTLAIVLQVERKLNEQRMKRKRLIPRSKLKRSDGVGSTRLAQLILIIVIMIKI
jgi:hypothetical protein